jgi:hypothetical protein
VEFIDKKTMNLSTRKAQNKANITTTIMARVRINLIEKKITNITIKPNIRLKCKNRM